MENWILQNESYLRLSIFGGLFTLFAIWEILAPDHKATQPRKERWVSNIALVVLNTIILRIVFPLTALGLAEFTEINKYGFLNIWSISGIASILLGIIFLDFVVYLQHILFHSVPVLWRLHQMHHTDVDLDVTSGTRFHPIEIMISMLIKWSAILVSGVSPITVIAFEVILNGMAMFNHSNISIPKNIDKYLRYIIVTPTLHQIHHSILVNEYNTNFGFNLSIWDRLLGTLKNRPEGILVLGLTTFREKKYFRLDWMLRIPFLQSK